MDRRVLFSATVVLSFALGCGRSAQEPAAKPMETAPPPPPAAAAAAPAAVAEPAPQPCATPVGDRADIAVAQDATVDTPCLEISKKVTKKIVWTVHPPATGLQITWKAECPGGIKPEKLPDPPECTGLTCALEDKHLSGILKRTEVCYRVEVTFKNKPPAVVDPKLIINP